MAGFVAVYDASVLYPSTLRDLLIRIAMIDLVRAKWTDQILDEVFDSLKSNRPDLDEQKLKRTRELMMTAVRDWRVTNYEALIVDLQLPDPDDRKYSVLAWSRWWLGVGVTRSGCRVLM